MFCVFSTPAMPPPLPDRRPSDPQGQPTPTSSRRNQVQGQTTPLRHQGSKSSLQSQHLADKTTPPSPLLRKPCFPLPPGPATIPADQTPQYSQTFRRSAEPSLPQNGLHVKLWQDEQLTQSVLPNCSKYDSPSHIPRGYGI